MEKAMVSFLAPSSFTFRSSTRDRTQGGIERKWRSVPKIKDSANLTCTIPRCTSKSFASILGNHGEIVQPSSSTNGFVSRRSCLGTPDHGDTIEKQSDLFISTWTKFSRKLSAFYIFARPHTMYGIILGMISASVLPIQTTSDLSPTFFIELLKAMVPTVLMNLHFSGLNHICDVEIDKINKPSYPLVSGELTNDAAIAITWSSAILSIVMGLMLNSKPLLICILTTFFLSVAYSVDLPFLRWKKNVFLTSTCIISVRALLNPLCYYAHVQKYILRRPLIYTKPVFFTVAFMSIFYGIISALKDLPDVEGDKAFGIKTLSVTFGNENVFRICIYALLALYGFGVAIGANSTLTINKIVVVLGHSLLALVLWTRAQSVNTSVPSSTLAFYLFVWKLVHAEYLLIPFVR